MITKIKYTAMENQYWLLGIHRTIIAEGKDTCGQYDFIEAIGAQGIKTPPHIHNNYSETEYVIEGELKILTDEETITLKAGDGYTIPKGKPHALSFTGSPFTKTLTIFSPAGFAEVIRSSGISGEYSAGLPDAKTDMTLFVTLSEKIGDITLGPAGMPPSGTYFQDDL